MTLRGIDVSYYQDNPTTKLDWNHVSGLDFMFARASIGRDVDATYGYHQAGAHTLGLQTGAYHFLEVGDGTAQADVFCNAIGSAAGLLCAVDIELMGILPATVTAFSERFATRFPRHPLFVYTNLNVGRHVFAGRTLPGPLWLAYFVTGGYPGDTAPQWDYIVGGAKPTIWQYGPAHEDGKTVDGDAYRGSITQLEAYAGGSGGLPNVPGVEMLPISSEVAMLVDLAIGAQLYDLDGATPLVKVSVAQTQTSPYELQASANSHFRVVPIVTGGQKVLAAVANSPSLNLRPVPTGYTQADLDNAKASGAEAQWLADTAAVKGAAPK